MSLLSSYDLDGIHSAARALGSVEVLQSRYKTGPDEPQIPAESIFSSLRTNPFPLQNNDDGMPSVAHVAAHLELLEAFLVLRKKVLGSAALDLAFGTGTMNWSALSGSVTQLQPRELKWKRFVDLAVVRFKIWCLVEKTSTGSGVTKALPPLGLSQKS